MNALESNGLPCALRSRCFGDDVPSTICEIDALDALERRGRGSKSRARAPVVHACVCLPAVDVDGLFVEGASTLLCYFCPWPALFVLPFFLLAGLLLFVCTLSVVPLFFFFGGL